MVSFRNRLKGWRLARYIERHRYFLYCRKIKRKNRRLYSKRNQSYQEQFKLLPGEDVLAEVCLTKKKINVGELLVICPKGSLVINLPQVFDFEKNYHESSMVVSVFRRAVARKTKISYISFERIRQISPSCIMVFMAYADLWKSYACKVRTETQTWVPSVVRAFTEIGFFSLLGFKPPTCAESDDGDRTYMPIITKNISPNCHVDIGHLTIEIQRQIEAFFQISLDGVRLYDSVTEAISNVYGHAYKNMSMGNFPRRWWMSVSYDVKSAELGIILFDYGLGIPSTMKNSTKFDLYRRLVNKIGGDWSERFRLSVAFERDRCKNRGNVSLVAGRGHGCRDMLRLVSQKDQNEIKQGSTFTVISGRARYDYEEGNNDGRGISESLNTKLQGTLIEWRIKL